MRKNKTSKIIISTILTLNMIFMTSCRLSILSQPWSMDRESIKLGKAILNALSEHDEEAFSDLFCERVKKQEGFSKQIERAMTFFEGEIEVVPSDYDLTSSGSESWDDGELVYMHLSDVIRDVSTDKGKTYCIIYNGDVANKKEPDRKGIIKVTIDSEEGECVVGGLE